MATSTQPQRTKPIWKKWWFWVIVVLVVGGIGNALGLGDEDLSAGAPVFTPGPLVTTEAAPTDEPAEPTPEPEPTQEQEDPAPTSEQVMAYVAEIAGYPDLNAGCIDGTRWMCNIEQAEPWGSGILVVQVRALEGGVEGDQVARSWFNFLNTSGTPLPDLYRVQITDMRGAQIGEYNHDE